MNSQICDSAIKQLIDNLESGFFIHHLEDRCIIATPFLYPDFASIEYSIELVEGGFLLTDNGETLNMLFVNGLSINNKSALWKQALNIARSHNVMLDLEGISVIATEDKLGEFSNNLLNAIQSIGYLLYKRKHLSTTTFNDEVEKTLITNDVKYDYNFIVSGKANTHRVKFFLNSGKNILLESISASTQQSARNKAKSLAYKWVDIRRINSIYQFITVVDDRKEKWEKFWSDEEAKTPIFTYSDVVIKWEEDQEKFIELVKK